MKRAIWILAAVGSLATFGTASAHTGTVPSSPVHVGAASTTTTHDGSVALGGGEYVVSGHVQSPRPLCERFRIVKLKAHYPNGRSRLLDFDLTSFEGGAWAMRADVSGADRLKAKVKALRLGPQSIAVSGSRPPATRHRPHKGHHRRTLCAAASVIWRAP